MTAPNSSSIAQAQAAAGIDPATVPRHVAVIMDGNGRWASARNLLRVKGHQQGVSAVRTTVTECAALGVEWLTLYAFSTENWRRPEAEVALLMELLAQFLVDELPTLQANDIRLQVAGQPWRLPQAVQALLQDSLEATANAQGMVLTLALSYGGRDELLSATRAIAEQVAQGALAVDEIDEAVMQRHLYTADAPDVDVVIRSAGEQRLSNFLPWQTVYAEFVSIREWWPDVSAEHIHAAIREFQGRQRRFGCVL